MLITLDLTLDLTLALTLDLTLALTLVLTLALALAVALAVTLALTPIQQMFKASVSPGGSRCCISLQLLYLPMSLSDDMGTSSTRGHLGETWVLGDMRDLSCITCLSGNDRVQHDATLFSCFC